MENKDRLINLERLNQFKLNLVESKDNSLDITNEDQSKIDIKAKISEEEGNILTLKEDGLYVAPDGSLLSTDNSISIEVTDEGTDLTLKKSEEEDNAIVKKEDGVFVQKYDMATEDEVMELLGDTPKFTRLFLDDGRIIEDRSTSPNYLSYRNRLVKVIIGKNVTSIQQNAFGRYDSEEGKFISFSKLQSITIPNTVTSIEREAFTNFPLPIDLIIPESVTNIDKYAFENSMFKSIKLNCNIQDIKFQTFIGCDNLEEIVIPKTVTTIEEQAFKISNVLKKITIYPNTINIAEDAFEDCGQTLQEEKYLYCNKEWYELYGKNIKTINSWTKVWID